MTRRYCGHIYTSWWQNDKWEQDGTLTIGDRFTRCIACGGTFNIDEEERKVKRKQDAAELLASIEASVAAVNAANEKFGAFKKRWLSP